MSIARDGRTDRPTDGQTDGRTTTPGWITEPGTVSRWSVRPSVGPSVRRSVCPSAYRRRLPPAARHRPLRRRGRGRQVALGELPGPALLDRHQDRRGDINGREGAGEHPEEHDQGERPDDLAPKDGQRQE